MLVLLGGIARDLSSTARAAVQSLPAVLGRVAQGGATLDGEHGVVKFADEAIPPSSDHLALEPLVLPREGAVRQVDLEGFAFG